MKKYIISNPEILGGMPVIVGTRVPIARILYHLKEGNSVKEIHKMYDWVDMKKLEGAIDEVIGVVTNAFNAKKIL